jgi:hypothetical protein
MKLVPHSTEEENPICKINTPYEKGVKDEALMP